MPEDSPCSFPTSGWRIDSFSRVSPIHRTITLVQCTVAQPLPRRPPGPGQLKLRPGRSNGPVDPHVYTFAPRLHQDSGESANEKNARPGENCCVREICTEICTDQSVHLHHFPGTESLPAGVGAPSPGACDIRGGAKIHRIPEDLPPIPGWRIQ